MFGGLPGEGPLQGAQKVCSDGAKTHKLSPHEQLVGHELPRSDGARLLRHDDGDAGPQCLLVAGEGERKSWPWRPLSTGRTLVRCRVPVQHRLV